MEELAISPSSVQVCKSDVVSSKVEHHEIVVIRFFVPQAESMRGSRVASSSLWTFIERRNLRCRRGDPLAEIESTTT